jgi:predicted ATP-grasp superfamily ATP-dependent carboligase
MSNGKSQESISVLIPDAGGDLETVKVLRCLGQASGLSVHILSTTRSPLFRFSRQHAHLHRHSSQNDDEWIDVIRKTVRRLEIDVVLPATLKGVQLVSQRRQEIAEVAAIPPIPEFATLELARNKWSLYQFAKEHGLPVVPSVLIDDEGKPVADSPDLDLIEYPALLKPTLQRGGSGIVKVQAPSDLQTAWKDKRISKRSEYILQSYVPGVDVSLSALCRHGEVKIHTVWRQLLPSKQPFCVPQLVEYQQVKGAVEVVKQLVSALQWDGVANIDLILDQRDGKLKILELNPRFWLSLLGSLSAGVNFPLFSCLIAVGAECPDIRQIESVSHARPAAALRMMLAQLIGRGPTEGFKWRGSSMQYTYSDPLPELIHAIRKTARRFWTPRQTNFSAQCTVCQISIAGGRRHQTEPVQ